MPHAFRSAALIEAENAQRKLERLRDRWLASKDTWFDGSAESVERRLANTDEVISLCKSLGSRLFAAKVGSDALALLPTLQGQRRELEAMRERIAGIPWEGERHELPNDRGLSAIPTHGDPSGQYDVRTQLTQDYAQRSNDQEDLAHRLQTLPNAGHETFGTEFGSPEEHQDEYDYRTNKAREYAGDQEAIHGPYEDAPRHRHEDLGFSPEDITRLKGAALEFVEGQNTTDAGELRIRAERYVEARTGQWTPESAYAAKRDFVAAVSAVAPRRVVQAAVEAPIQDFDDSLMFS